MDQVTFANGSIFESDVTSYGISKPGKYTFSYAATNLCSTTAKNITGEVRCPPPAQIGIQSSVTGDVLQGQTVTFTAIGAPSTGWKSNGLSWSWSVVAPAEAGGANFAAGIVNSLSTFKATFKISGAYSVDVVSFDGCSYVPARYCFSVICNCPPSANAGGTPTIWSNTASSSQVLSGLSTAAQNTAQNNQNGEGFGFKLDGSLSTDFDLFSSATEVLTYDWSIISWVPSLSDLPFGTITSGTSIRDCNGTDQPQGRFAFPKWNSNPPTANFAPPPGGVWNVDGTGMPAATTQFFGYTVVYNNVPLSKEYTFRRLPKISTTTTVQCSTEDVRGAKCGDLQMTSTNSSRQTAATGYPKWIITGNGQGILENFMRYDWDPKLAPKFDNVGDPTRPNIDPTTTSCMTYVTKTVAVSEVVETHYNTTTVVTVSGGDNYDFCTIKIRQSSAFDPTATLTVFNPQYTASLGQRVRPYWLGEFGGYEVCRGLWTIRLTVKDACGAQTQSFDDLRLTLRCNRPPVSVLCCDTTIPYSSDASRFPQVTIDGRSSNDKDNSDLTYYWSFLQYPAAHQAACETQVGAPCEQDYCQRVITGSYRTWVYVGPFATNGVMSLASFGNVTRLYGDNPYSLSGVTAYENTCAPNVYPVIYDFSVGGRLITNAATSCVTPGDTLPVCTGTAACPTYCSYQVVDNTQYHKGNSAYFRPTVPGTYKVQLAVFDGCSTSVDTVSILAQCPSLTASPSIERITGTTSAPATSVIYRPSGTRDSVNLNSVAKYEGSTFALQYTWKYARLGTTNFTTAGITNNRAQNTTFSPVQAGVFSFTLTVEDTCQSKIFGPLTLTVVCNSAPSAPKWTTAPPALPVQYDATTRSFPVLNLVAAATDPEGDDLSYTWAATRNGASVTGLTPVGNTGTASFRPDLTAPDVLYTISVFASDGCQAGPTLTSSVSYRCNNSLSLSLDVAIGQNRGTNLAVYDFATAAFPVVKIDAIPLSSFPYPQQNTYSWCVVTGTGVVSTLCPTANHPNAVSATNSNLGAVSFTPTVVGDYTVSLLVNDQCSSQSRDVVISTSCPVNPSAILITSSPYITWNSYKSTYNGGFDAVDLDGTGSTAGRGVTTNVPLSYSFSVSQDGAAAAPVSTDLANTAGKIPFTASSAGSYVFTLTVSNGVCKSGQSTPVSITAVCLTIIVDLRVLLGPDHRPSPLSATPQWTGVRFEHVLIDGSGIRYGQVDQTGVIARPGNMNALRYSWSIDKAPQGSIFESSGIAPPVFNPISGDYNRAVTSTTTNRIGNDTVVTTVQYSKSSSSSTTTIGSTLFNHHYNLPVGGFLPDVQGAYKVSLSVTDGCNKYNAGTVDINAVCPDFTHVQPLVVNRQGQPFPNNQVVQSGSEYVRVTIDGRATAPYGPCGTLTYQWTLAKPDGSRAALTNSNGNIVSLIPDVVGTYSVSYSASDGCQSPRVVAASFTVGCKQPGTTTLPTDVTSTPSPVTPLFDLSISSTIRNDNFIDFSDASASGLGQVGGAVFNLTAINIKRCDYTRRTWTVVKRECSDVAYRPSLATVPPIGPAAICNKTKTLTWKVVSWPCGWKDMSNFQPPDNCLGEGCTLSTNTAGLAKFNCKSPGTYTLSLTIDDGCSSSTETTTVACRCATTIVTYVPAATTMLRVCPPGSAQQKAWGVLNIGGSFVAYTDRVGAPLAPCPASPNPVPPPPPAADSSCCSPITPCAACAQCPDCPQCPNGFVAAGQVSRSQASTVAGSVAGALIPDMFAVRADATREAATAGVPAAADDLWSAIPGAVFGVQAPTFESEARPSFVSDSEEDEVSTSLLLGVVIPISVIIVVSVVGNVLLINKLRSVNELKRQLKRPVSVVLQ